MTPEQLAKSGTEHAEQMALFCWAGQAEQQARFPCLKWLHAIPNAGARGNKVAAAQLKAEGVKAGVFDIFLPYVTYFESSTGRHKRYAGLYIEMKREAGVPSDVSKEQIQFAKHITEQGYAWIVCFGWRQAAVAIEAYLKCEIPTLTPKQAQVLALVAAK